MATPTNTQSPPRQSISISKYPKLTSKQAGHIRHFHNLTSQPDGQWNHFTTHEYFQEFDDSSRYTLATMAYATGAAHYHRLPALRGPLQTLMRQTIAKMLRREVWAYWFMSSVGSKMFDPSLTELRVPWANPVAKENIMYSGHLLLMTSLYTMLFDDDVYEREEGLVFDWNPLFTGLGPERYTYSISSLQDLILKQMEANDWVGVCCEPNAVFVVCNQFPLIAMRYNDFRNGTNTIEGILEKYQDALHRKGMIGETGLYASFFAVKQGKAIPARQGAHTAWANAFMNSWNPEAVRAGYEKTTVGFLTPSGADGSIELNPSRVAMAFRRLINDQACDPDEAKTLERARDPSNHVVNPAMPFETLNWGSFTMMLSELGKEKELNDLLTYLDTNMNPTWENGGFFYPRNDKLADDQWRLVHMEPHSGNAMIGYARLNVEDGQRKMWLKPWTREILGSRPYIDGISFADDVDFLRGVWDAEAGAMVVTMRRWRGEKMPYELAVRNLEKGRWSVFVNGIFVREERLESKGDVLVECEIGQAEVDVVVEKCFSSAL